MVVFLGVVNNWIYYGTSSDMGVRVDKLAPAVLNKHDSFLVVSGVK
jgi:hypothetical protein